MILVHSSKTVILFWYFLAKSFSFKCHRWRWTRNVKKSFSFIYGLNHRIKFDKWAQNYETMIGAFRLAQLQKMKHNHGKPKTNNNILPTQNTFKNKYGQGNDDSTKSVSHSNGKSNNLSESCTQNETHAQNSETPQLVLIKRRLKAS